MQKQTYIMSDDPQLFKPPPYPEAPKDMYYQVPKTKPEPEKLGQLFPWESHAPKPSRVFLDDGQSLASAHGKYSAPRPQDETIPYAKPWKPEPVEEPSDSWENYTRSNAWDEVPAIQKYIQGIQQARKAKTQVISGTNATSQHHPAEEPAPTQRGLGPGHAQDTTSSIKLTDFPSEVERPSLPVTPAPISRPFVRPGGGPGGENENADADSELPAAEGVPNQEDWVGLTVDVFLQLLRVSYLYWNFTESPGPSRRAAAAAV